MQYFVTGATGFIGKRLVKTLLARKGADGVLPAAQGKRSARCRSCSSTGASTKARAIPVFGDLTGKKLGVAADDIKSSKGKIDALFHLAAVYDLKADEETQIQANIEGTRNAVEFAKAIDARHLHHVSSIAAAGLYEGVFREDMFDEAENLDHPYFNDQAREREDRAQGVQGAVDGVPPGLRRRRLEDRRDGQDRRPVLLLQADPAHAAVAAAVDADGGPRGRAPQHRAGGLRRRRASTTSRTARPSSRASASTSSTRWATASATCSTSSARPRTRRR